MPLPKLHNWQDTRDGLHRAAQVVGVIRKAMIPPQPNALHLSLYVTAQGLSSGLLSAGHSFALNFVQRTLEYHQAGRALAAVPVQDHTQVSLFRALVEKSGAARSMDDLLARLTDDAAIRVDKQQAADYAQALYTIYTAAARFRARLYGTMTPLVVWPHHFDLSFLKFVGHEPDEHSQPHMNFGFAPYSAGIERPYLYAYIWPRPDDLTQRPLPAPARWHTEGWIGARVDYDDFAGESEPEAFVEHILSEIHEVLTPR